MRVAGLAFVLVLTTGACSKASNEAAPKSEASAREATETQPTARRRCARGVTPLPERIQRGVCVAHNYQAQGSRGYGSKTAASTLQELSELGVGWVSLTPFGFMQRLDEPTVHPIGDYRAGETDDRMRREIREAKKRGLNVALKPHIWIVDGEWRGEIELEDDAEWNRWFDAYERWMLNYADMAEREGVDLLVVGVELRTTEKSLERRWRRLIRKVRKRYHGEITYSANWDDAATLPWWDAVDYVGVQFYPPLAESEKARPDAIRDALVTQLDEIEALSKRSEKPVLFTEVGFRASGDALVHPHAWPEHAGRVVVDEETQALGYEIFTDPKTTEEGPAGFSPRGKIAEGVVRAAYDGNCDAPGASP